VRLRAAGHDFTLRSAYKPKTINELYNPILSFQASFPSLEPLLSKTWELDGMVHVYLSSAPRTSDDREPPPMVQQSLGDGPYGLTVRSVRNPNDKTGTGTTKMYAWDADGGLIVVINCAPAILQKPVFHCPLDFTTRGLRVYASLQPGSYASWRESLQALISLLSEAQTRSRKRLDD
jgi:hypothetical protein